MHALVAWKNARLSRSAKVNAFRGSRVDRKYRLRLSRNLNSSSSRDGDCIIRCPETSSHQGQGRDVTAFAARSGDEGRPDPPPTTPAGQFETQPAPSRDTLRLMGFVKHCEGQRFDRARILRLLRTTRRTLNKECTADEALRAAIEAVRVLDIPHMERFDEIVDGEIIH